VCIWRERRVCSSVTICRRALIELGFLARFLLRYDLKEDWYGMAGRSQFAWERVSGLAFCLYGGMGEYLESVLKSRALGLPGMI
jgi:hypothetical protein